MGKQSKDNASDRGAGAAQAKPEATKSGDPAAKAAATEAKPQPRETERPVAAAKPAEVAQEAPVEAIEETNRCMVVTRRPMQVGDERCQAGTVIGFISTTPGTHTPEFVAHCIARGVVQVIPVGE